MSKERRKEIKDKYKSTERQRKARIKVLRWRKREQEEEEMIYSGLRMLLGGRKCFAYDVSDIG